MMYRMHFFTPATGSYPSSRRSFSAQCLALLSGLATLPLQSAFAKSTSEALLAYNAPKDIDPAGYLVSEKLDGVRALWDGKQLRFRSGRTVAAPAWFTAKLPREPLDGELWLARRQFDVLSGMVRKERPADADWQQINYMLFELPAGSGTFEERAEQLQTIVKSIAWPQLQAVAQVKVADHAALQAKLKTIHAAGGEGLVLHLASAPVTTGRSNVLLKLKAVQDAEAVVTGHVPGKGKYLGVLGALQVETADGQRFKLGTGLSDAQRHKPPAIGSTITYSYRDTTPSGKPRFAAFLRVYDGV
jgi:DNA ligase 1